MPVGKTGRAARPGKKGPTRCARELAVIVTLLAFVAVRPPLSVGDGPGELWWRGDYEGAETGYGEAGGVVSRLELGALHRSLGNFRRAARHYRAVLGMTVADTAAAGTAVIDEVYVPLAESLYYSGELGEAESVFRDVLRLEPESLAGLFGLGRVLYEKGDLAAADATLSLAATLHPSFPGSFIYLARTAERQGDPGKAIERYARALGIDKLQVELGYSIGELHLAGGRFEEAFREFHRLDTIDPENRYVIARLDEVRPRLAPEEEELIPVKTLARFSPVKPAASAGKIPTVRVALNTDRRGKSLPLSVLTFTASGAFRVLPPKGRGNTSTLFTGKPNETCRIELRDGNMVLARGTAASGGPPDEPLALLEGGAILAPIDPSKGSFILRRVEYAKGFAWGGIADRQYRGRLEISLSGDGLSVVNVVNLEEYLYSVAPSEMPISFPAEALRAQAVIARSYALSNVRYAKPHASDGYDLCDGQHCQVYSGVTGEYAKTSSAVDTTRGRVLTYGGAVARPFYHSTCGGHTRSAGEIGWGEAAYLRGVFDGPKPGSFPASPREFERWIKSRPDAYCRGGETSSRPEFRWLRIVPAPFVQEKLNRTYRIGNILDLIVLRRDASGYVSAVEVMGSEDTVILDKDYEIRRFLGIGSLRSNLFWLETKPGIDGTPEEFVVYGGGWGHGVGLCQVGASGMAKRGLSYRQILSHYYPGAVITNLAY